MGEYCFEMIGYRMSRYIPAPCIEIKLHHGAIDLFKDIELYDTRFVNCCLIGENQGITFGTGQYYAIDLVRYGEVCGLDKGKAYKHALEAALKLSKLRLSVKLMDGSTLHTTLIYAVKEDIDTGYILIQWNRDFIPYISGQMPKGRFLMVDARMDGVTTNKRYCLYLLIQKHLWKLGSEEVFYLTKQALRDALGLQEQDYKEFKVFNSSLLKPTLKDIYSKLGINLKTKVRGDRVEFSHAV